VVYCDAAAIDFCGPMVIQLLHELLAMFPQLALSLVYLKSWSRRDKADLKKAQGKWDKRLRVTKLTSLFDLNKEYHTHDWAILPSVRADFGFSAARALACGTPVVCHDVEPFSELVSKDSGVLVPCEVRTGAAKAPVAVPHLGNWVEACEAALGPPSGCSSCRPGTGGLAELQAAFNNTWRQVLDE
jgi:glycosyltransferase involved in cell wall biosynthesis